MVLSPHQEFPFPAQAIGTEKEWTALLNDTRDWLKHVGDQGPRTIVNYEAVIMLWRALTKYHQNYGEETREMADFLQWGRDKGLTKDIPPKP